MAELFNAVGCNEECEHSLEDVRTYETLSRQEVTASSEHRSRNNDNLNNNRRLTCGDHGVTDILNAVNMGFRSLC